VEAEQDNYVFMGNASEISKFQMFKLETPPPESKRLQSKKKETLIQSATVAPRSAVSHF
jgi:hypothetical protein